MLRSSVLLTALAVNAPSVWAALYVQTTTVETAAIRFLLTVPVVAVLLYLVRAAMGSPRAESEHRRRAEPEQRPADD